MLNRNSAVSLQTHFREAVKELEMESPNVADALREINHIHQLGSPSFASKHLRFLRPDLCPILDSIISGRLHYRANPQGYAQLSRDCLEIAALLEQYSTALSPKMN